MRVPITRFTVNGNSMIPAFKEGQDVLSFNWFYKPKLGDLVVVKYGGREIIKRVTKVLDREILIEGDNKKESTDSRHFGPVKMDQIVGKVIFSSENHPERAKRVEGSDMIDCPQFTKL